ncbi:MAG: hypothetical protein DLM62_05000 [Pseudonocardiales bacterium]|nr:MAG: hypothetical protein DLM62_05000 [Pseudonocardiales bacterium]
MNVDDLIQLIDNVHVSAFSLETLPTYLVPQEAEEFASWTAGWPRMPRTPDTHEYLRELQRDVARGIRWYRVHILDQPLTAYLRFELCGYLSNREAGEEIYVVDRDTHPDLGDLHEDFWLYDDEIAVRVVYDEEGRFLRSEPGDDLEHYREMRDTAMRHAETLNDYMVRRDLTPETLRTTV